MTVDYELEYDRPDFSEIFNFEIEPLAEQLLIAVSDAENCPYEATVSLFLMDGEAVHEINREHRGMDKTTDVLSFPALAYPRPSDFSYAEANEMDAFDPDTGELMLGDILINVEKVKEQAEEYGHSTKREFAFLVTHSLLHLLGYDHMAPEEAAVMEEKQENLLTKCGIPR